jgi:hypothetical protein
MPGSGRRRLRDRRHRERRGPAGVRANRRECATRRRARRDRRGAYDVHAGEGARQRRPRAAAAQDRTRCGSRSGAVTERHVREAASQGAASWPAARPSSPRWRATGPGGSGVDIERETLMLRARVSRQRLGQPSARRGPQRRLPRGRGRRRLAPGWWRSTSSASGVGEHVLVATGSVAAAWFANQAATRRRTHHRVVDRVGTAPGDPDRARTSPPEAEEMEQHGEQRDRHHRDEGLRRRTRRGRCHGQGGERDHRRARRGRRRARGRHHRGRRRVRSRRRPRPAPRPRRAWASSSPCT